LTQAELAFVELPLRRTLRTRRQPAQCAGAAPPRAALL